MESWLIQNGLGEYLEIFIKQNIDMQQLAELEEQDLRELGLSVGHRKKFRSAVLEMKREEEGTPTSSSPDISSIKNTEIFEYTCKIIVVGDQNTGKTSLIERYTHGIFDKMYKATIGVDFCLKDLKWNSNTQISLQLWDIAGQERFTNLTRMYYREARGAFIVFDVCKDRTLLEGAMKWKADIDNKVLLPNGKPLPVILLANKCDLLSPEKLTEINLDRFCKENGFTNWFLTSAKENIKIEEAANFLVETILNSDEDFLKSNVSPKKIFRMQFTKTTTST